MYRLYTYTPNYDVCTVQGNGNKLFSLLSNPGVIYSTESLLNLLPGHSFFNTIIPRFLLGLIQDAGESGKCQFFFFFFDREREKYMHIFSVKDMNVNPNTNIIHGNYLVGNFRIGNMINYTLRFPLVTW